MALFAGLMSGTSLDGVDAVLAQWPEEGEGGGSGSGSRPARPVERAFVHRPMPPRLREELLALNSAGGEGELHRAELAANALARLYAQATQALLDAAGVAAPAVQALGAHGQTVRHRPREFDGTGYTTQLLNGALLAELAGIDVVCDFRSRDVAAGGQGAPLVPAFHAEVFRDGTSDVAVLNIGGIANLTLLPAAGSAAAPVRGFDCGPGNVLMDFWCEHCTGRPFDEGGRLAAAGRVHQGLLQHCLGDPFFARKPPKSTGRDLFGRQWLDARLAAVQTELGTGEAPEGDIGAEDVMATLAELTAAAACDALARHAPGTRTLLVCGGGAFNGHLLARLAARAGVALAQPVSVASTATAGIEPDHVEALAFAWLARAFCARRGGSLAEVTGAAGPRVLGALYPR
ncbi:MAG: anhydro-N-acetylmuramic acid kinase [Rubrivivax sp.]|nr:anhydro-N-acetylmuramic acid kinase [Rubrivivax sp.]